MPLARGIMQMGRINVYPTITTLVSITPPGSANCGDTVTFHVTVANARGISFPVPTGIVSIIDQDTGTVLGSGSLVAGAAAINTFPANGTVHAVALYAGVVNQFGNSQSFPPEQYSTTIIDTTTTVTTSSGSYFCFHLPFSISAHVAPNSGMATPTGTVTFNLYSDAVTFVTIGTSTLSGGNASINIPADSTVPGNDYYIQAVYNGGGCFGPGSSPLGISGTIIHSIDVTQNTTNTVASISGSSTFCIHNPSTFNATITSAHLGGPSVGSVTWTAFKSPTTIVLGTDSTVVAGLASITVPGNTFSSQGVWSVHANYTGDGNCFADSVSPNISVTATEFTPSISYNSGSTFFCYAVAQSYNYHVSGPNGGTVSGTFVLKSSFGNTLATVTTSGPASGFNFAFSVPAFTFSDGSQNIFVQFTSDGTSCYGNVNSGNTGVNVKSFLNQNPSSTSLLVSPSSGYHYTTFNFTINVFKGSGTGPLDGAGSLNGSATLYSYDGSFHSVNSNIHIYDYGSYGSGSYSQFGFSLSTTGFEGRWNGNLCYNYQDSPFVGVTINPDPPH
jgi:hypothetical protein